MPILQLLDRANVSGNPVVRALAQLVRSSITPGGETLEDLFASDPGLKAMKQCLERAVEVDANPDGVPETGPQAGSSAIMHDGETTILIKTVPSHQPYILEGVWEVFDQYSEKHCVEKNEDGSWNVILVEYTGQETFEREAREKAHEAAAKIAADNLLKSITGLGLGLGEAPAVAHPPEVTKTAGLTVNAPQYFRRPDFMAWLNQPANKIFTYHTRGTDADEWSDTIVLVDSFGEGDSSDMPEDIWQEICAIAYNAYGGEDAPARLNSHIAVRLTNLAE
jgi:hypothetical protein